ncbi:MAG: PcfJ domain-containing protein [Prevotella sp.]|nr:PcfJ domain-containing protein [Prevotella sp.]
MKPRNAREKEVFALYRRLPELSDTQVLWLKQEVMERRIYTSGKKCWCTYCGGEWEEKIEKEEGVAQLAECPHCGHKAVVHWGRNKTFHEFAYAQFLQVFKGWQVIRYVMFGWWCKEGREPELKIKDVIQKWCQPGRPMITLSCYIGMCSYYRSSPYSWYDEELSVKPNHGHWYSEWMKVSTYPRMSILPVYKKHIGSHPNFDDLDLFAPTLLGDVFGCPYLESLWKEGKWGELQEMWHYTDELNKYWPSIKIALRHGFKPAHWISYFDYLKALKFLHYDMHSPRYVAPPDWLQIHDLVMRQYRNRIEKMESRRNEAQRLRWAMEEEERARQRQEDAKKSATAFLERIAKFVDLRIESADIEIIPLKSVEEFWAEGEAMHHCVFNMGYYKKPESLILSARNKEDGERVETIEVDLQQWAVRQSQGKYNVPSEKHEEIVSLVKGAMPEIKRLSASRS